jgi:hypothetical protein
MLFLRVSLDALVIGETFLESDLIILFMKILQNGDIFTLFILFLRCYIYAIVLHVILNARHIIENACFH